MKKIVFVLCIATGCSARIGGELHASATKIGVWNFQPQQCFGSTEFVGVDLVSPDSRWMVRVIHDELRGNTARILDRQGAMVAQFSPGDCKEDRFSAHRHSNGRGLGGVYGAVDMECQNAKGEAFAGQLTFDNCREN